MHNTNEPCSLRVQSATTGDIVTPTDKVRSDVANDYGPEHVIRLSRSHDRPSYEKASESFGFYPPLPPQPAPMNAIKQVFEHKKAQVGLVVFYLAICMLIPHSGSAGACNFRYGRLSLAK
jgi:hypothetical protein